MFSALPAYEKFATLFSLFGHILGNGAKKTKLVIATLDCF